MTNFPLKKKVIEALLMGVTKSKDNFLSWTNDRLALPYAPLNHITIHVAQELSQIDNAPEIFIDASVEDILRCSLKKRSAYKKYMQKSFLSNGVFSITLDERFAHKNDNDSVSRAIISIKSGVINAKLEYTNEIDRICKMLDSSVLDDSSLDYGVFVFSSTLSQQARKKLENRIPQIIAKFDNIVKKHTNLKATFTGEKIVQCIDNGQWCVGCYIIERC